MKRTGLICAIFFCLLLVSCAQEVKTQENATLSTGGQYNTFIPQGQLKELEIIAKQFEFVPNTITVNQGDTVRLTITSIDVTHGFMLSAYDINEQLPPGVPVTVEFVADKKGSFEFICNVMCGKGHKTMKGMLIVQ